MRIDACLGQQEVYVKPVECITAHSGNITKDELRERVRLRVEEQAKEKEKQNKLRVFKKFGIELL